MAGDESELHMTQGLWSCDDGSWDSERADWPEVSQSPCDHVEQWSCVQIGNKTSGLMIVPGLCNLSGAGFQSGLCD